MRALFLQFGEDGEWKNMTSEGVWLDKSPDSRPFDFEMELPGPNALPVVYKRAICECDYKLNIYTHSVAVKLLVCIFHRYVGESCFGISFELNFTRQF